MKLPIRPTLDCVIEACQPCAGAGLRANPPAACPECSGSGRVPVEPVRILLDYLAYRIAEAHAPTPHR